MTQIMKTKMVEQKVTEKFVCDRCGKETEGLWDNWSIPDWFKKKYDDTTDMPGEEFSCTVEISAGHSYGGTGIFFHWDYHLCGECAGHLLDWLKSYTGHEMKPTSKVDF